jgi:hypothetical protein
LLSHHRWNFLRALALPFVRVAPVSFKSPPPEGLFNFDGMTALAAGLKESAYIGCFCADSPDISGDHVADILLRGLAKP